MRRMLYAGSLLFFTSACAPEGVTVVRPPQFDYYYERDLGSALAQYGDVPTLVLGNPFDQPIGQVEQAVTSALKGNYFGPELTFAPAEGGTEAPYRLLVVFNPAPNARPDKVCHEPDQPLRPSKKGVSVLMAICSSTYRVSSTVGYNASVEKPEGPEFEGLMRRTMSSLLPPNRYDINGGEDRRRT